MWNYYMLRDIIALLQCNPFMGIMNLYWAIQPQMNGECTRVPTQML